MISMSHSKLIQCGKDVLQGITAKSARFFKFKGLLEKYEFKKQFKDDVPAWLTCVLALEAVECGNLGVGSIILDDRDRLIAVGCNQVFSPYFRSDAHAEMIAMDEFEKENPEIDDMRSYKIYTSLESCPMCMTRLIVSGINKIYHVADDLYGGMVHLAEKLPPVWLELIESQRFEPAKCSPALRKAASEIFISTRAERDALLFKRRGL